KHPRVACHLFDAQLPKIESPDQSNLEFDLEGIPLLAMLKKKELSYYCPKQSALLKILLHWKNLFFRVFFEIPRQKPVGERCRKLEDYETTICLARFLVVEQHQRLLFRFRGLDLNPPGQGLRQDVPGSPDL